jgi:Ca2+-binding EF-hand superfamily protein
MNKYIFPALIVSSLALAGSALAGADGGCDKAEGKAGHGAAARFGEVDTNKDGKISLAELTASRETWLTRIDTNKDGVASQAEIDASFQAGRQEHLQKRFERDDANKDGRVTRDESHMPSAWFERADSNKDGALTLAELSSAKPPSMQRDPHAGKPAGRMGRMDSNGDGKVERSELKTAAEQQFARLDTNKDGSLTNDEFASGHVHFRGRHPREGGHGPQNAAPAPTRS